MLQTLASVQKDEPKFAKPGHAALFIEVEDLEDIKKRLAGYPIEMEERMTFYGMKEVGSIRAGRAYGDLRRESLKLRINADEHG